MTKLYDRLDSEYKNKWLGIHIHLRHDIDFFGNIKDSISDTVVVTRNEIIDERIINTLCTEIDFNNLMSKIEKVCNEVS